MNKTKLNWKLIVDDTRILFKNKYLYIGLIVLFLGIQLNFIVQTYLFNSFDRGNSLPPLTDLILDNIPLWNIDFLCDIFSIVSFIIFIIYVIHKQQISRVPYFLLLCGIFYLVRAAFVVLTPLGNPPLFDGTQGIFNGFSKIELGMYPSGHTGIAILFFFLAESKIYKILLISSVTTIIAGLFLSRVHYSIDILSAIFFAYAIKSFGDKYLLPFIVKKA